MEKDQLAVCSKPIWTAEMWQDTAAWLVKLSQVDASIPKNQVTEEQCNNG